MKKKTELELGLIHHVLIIYKEILPYGMVILVTYLNNDGIFTLDTTILEQSKDGQGLNSEQWNSDNFGWTQFKVDDIDNDGIDDIIAENFHDGKYNGLKLINGTWTKYRFN